MTRAGESRSKKRWVSKSWALMRTDDGRDPAFARHLRDLARPDQIAYVRIMNAYGGEPVGVEFHNPRFPGRWAFIVPEMSDPQSNWRIQYFDADSFFRHSSLEDLDAAVQEMIAEGYTEPDCGALARIEGTDRWRMGCIRADLIRRHAIGEFDWRECTERMAAVTVQPC